MDVSFVVLTAAGQKRGYPVRLPIIVGRSEEAKFRFTNDSVSRRHCEFFIEDDVVFVRDLGSTNGTLLDRTPLQAGEATAVSSGSVVHVGSVAFRVEYDAAAAPQEDQTPAGSDTVPLSTGNDAAAAATQEADDPGAAEEPQTAFAGLPDTDEPVAEDGGWPTEPEAAAPPDDDNLNDFFKSLS
jgi:pSer/pThr/pTyr-binding forkhead associated (FHA) protein